MRFIKQLLNAEMTALKEQFPAAEVKPFVLMDGSLRLSSHSTEKEAMDELVKWTSRDLLTSMIEDFIDEVRTWAAAHDFPEDEALLMLREEARG